MRIILGLILLLFALSMVYAAPSGSTSEYVTVRVCSGDTVWDIAGRQASDKEDIRDIIWQIREMNRLDKNAFLQPGLPFLSPPQQISLACS